MVNALAGSNRTGLDNYNYAAFQAGIHDTLMVAWPYLTRRAEPGTFWSTVFIEGPNTGTELKAPIARINPQFQHNSSTMIWETELNGREESNEDDQIEIR